jgi:hypothetical protein
MADFSFDKVILMQGSIGTGGDFQWTNTFDWSNDGIVADGAGIGEGSLTTDDTFTAASVVTSGDYAGHYISVTSGGETYNFGIFSTNHSTWTYCIPYDSKLSPSDLSNLVPQSGGGTDTSADPTLDNAANCFLTGTRIATPDGARPIETLQPGDRVLTAEGAATPVLWVWQQEITNIFGLGAARAPIRVAAHALAPDCPSRDLVVTADHALLVDGLLINAGALVNGTTITAEPLARMPARFSYWHVETEDHTVLLAENCPAESFIDYTPRESFDNYAAYLECVGEERIIEEMPIPRISTQRLLLPDLRRRLGVGRVA